MSEAAVIVRHNSGETSLPVAGAVLIIDDEAVIRESLETLLELEGYAVQSAATGEEGLARIGERSFDLVLLDLALPERWQPDCERVDPAAAVAVSVRAQPRNALLL